MGFFARPTLSQQLWLVDSIKPMSHQCEWRAQAWVQPGLLSEILEILWVRECLRELRERQKMKVLHASIACS